MSAKARTGPLHAGPGKNRRNRHVVLKSWTRTRADCCVPKRIHGDLCSAWLVERLEIELAGSVMPPDAYIVQQPGRCVIQTSSRRIVFDARCKRGSVLPLHLERISAGRNLLLHLLNETIFQRGLRGSFGNLHNCV